MRFATTILTLFLSFAFSTSAFGQLQVPHQIKWKTLRTAHFDIIVDEQQIEIGHLYANKLERAYFDLSIFFRQFPNKRIPVVINDKTDATNGYATPIPYSHIMIYPVLPGPDGSLADIHDWAYELLAHEFVHILTFEAHRGIMKPLKGIFGNIIAPNSLMPNWWKEGAAVQVESYLSTGGRLKSYYQDATLRALSAANKLMNYDIAQANEYIYTWPQGSRPYLFGSLYWSELIAEFSPQIMGDLHDRQGGRVPYFIEEPSRALTKKSYEAYYQQAMTETDQRAKKQLEELRKVPTSQFFYPKNSFLNMTSPMVSPDGKKLAFIAEKDNHSRSLQILRKTDPKGGFDQKVFSKEVDSFDESFIPNQEDQDTPATGSLQRVAWFPDSHRLVYDKIGYTNRIQRFSDLYLHDLSTNKTTRLTESLRAREPAVSPDGKFVSFVKLSASKTELGLLNIENKEIRTLYQAPLQHRISSPSYLSDQEIVFALRDTTGTETLQVINLNDSSVSPILPEHKQARFPAFMNNHLYFVSALSGVLNLYKSEAPFETATPLTHSESGVFLHTIDPINGDIIASIMTETGIKIGVLSSEKQLQQGPLPKIEKIFSDRFPKEVISKFDESSVQPQISDYSPYGYLWPQYWIPFLTVASSDTGVSFQASTSGQDPLEKHRYSLTAGYDSLINKGSLFATYINNTFETPAYISGYRRSYFLGSENNIVEDTAAQIGLMPDLWKSNIYESFQYGAIFQERTLGSTVKRAGVFAQANYRNFSQAGAEISPEDGYSLYGGIHYFVKNEDFIHHHQYLAGANLFFRGLGRHHAINLRLDGTHIPESGIPVSYGSATDSMPYSADPAAQRFLLRGYKHGQILGKSLATLNGEYRIPIRNIYKGDGTDPYFIRRVSGSITVDGASADGFFFNTTTKNGQIDRINFGDDVFWSTGLELKLETHIGYIIPINLVIGYYYGFQAEEDSRGVVVTALQITGF